MITIEKLILVSKDVVAMNSFRSVYGWIELVRFAISQHEEIERLRAELDRAKRSYYDQHEEIGDLHKETEKLRRERDEAYERAAQAAANAILDSDDKTPLEYIADMAIRAIRALKTGEPK